jgi:hypothetical protein
MSVAQLTRRAHWLCAVAVACSNTAGSESPIGRLTLVAYNGSPLPIVVERVPSIGPDGTPVDCSISVVAGTLDLIDQQAYDLTLQTRDSCSGVARFATSDTGTYSRARDSLTFHPRGAGQLTYWAQAIASRVTLHYSGSALDFAL